MSDFKSDETDSLFVWKDIRFVINGLSTKDSTFYIDPSFDTLTATL
jgi:hypothetical protein